MKKYRGSIWVRQCVKERKRRPSSSPYYLKNNRANTLFALACENSTSAIKALAIEKEELPENK
ncbi:hypothetical protein [Sinomicrobium sp. M5D2P9]